MKRRRMLTLAFLFVALLVFSGCATTKPGESLLGVGPSANEADQIHEANGFWLDDFQNAKKITCVLMQIPGFWLGDGIGHYQIEDEKGNPQNVILARNVWSFRIFGTGLNSEKNYPAFKNRRGSHVLVILPGLSVEQVKKGQGVLLSGSKRFALTAQGKLLEVDTEKLEEFFQKNPALLKDLLVLDASPGTAEGIKVLEKIKDEFPRTVVIDNKQFLTSADPEVLMAQVGMLNHSSSLQRISDSKWGGISVETFVFPYPNIIRSIINMAMAAADESLQGPFFEARVTGLEAGQIFGKHLDEAERVIQELQAENLRLRELLGRQQ